MNQLTIFRNWWELAENRDTDEKRLAFYDAIMRYAFEGKVPDRPVKGVSRGVDYAAWDAYQSVLPVISESVRKSEAGSLGGRGNVKQDAKQDKQDAKHRAKHKVSTAQSTAQSAQSTNESALRNFIIEKNRIEENRIEENGGGGTPTAATTATATATTATVEDVENYFKRVSQTTTLRVTDEERSEFTEWLVLNEFRTSHGIVAKSRIGATFTAWRSIRQKELAKARPAESSVSEDAGHRNITEEDL